MEGGGKYPKNHTRGVLGTEGMQRGGLHLKVTEGHGLGRGTKDCGWRGHSLSVGVTNSNWGYGSSAYR